MSLGPEAYASPNSKKLKISLGPEAYASQKLETSQKFARIRSLYNTRKYRTTQKTQNFAWARSVCIPKLENTSFFEKLFF